MSPGKLFHTGVEAHQQQGDGKQQEQRCGDGKQ